VRKEVIMWKYENNLCHLIFSLFSNVFLGENGIRWPLIIFSIFCHLRLSDLLEKMNRENKRSDRLAAYPS